MPVPRSRPTKVLAALLAISLTTLPLLVNVKPTLGQQRHSARRAESAGPAVHAFPTRLPRVTPAAVPLVVPYPSNIDPARLRALKRQHFVPQAPLILDRPRSGALGPAPGPLIPTLQRGFSGLTNADNFAAGLGLIRPPDPDIAAGPNHLVTVVNSEIRISSKGGTTISTATLGTWFSPVAAGCGMSGCVPFDPHIAYDSQEGHWIVVALHRSLSPQISRLLISVSQTTDPTGMWNFYNLDATLLYTPTGQNTWVDYPDVGFDGILSTASPSGAVYVTANQNAFVPCCANMTARVWILSKAELYSGAALNYWTTWDHLNVTGTQVFTYRAAKMYGNPGVEYLVNSADGSNFIMLWSVTPNYPPQAFGFTNQFVFNVGSYGVPPDAAQPGCGNLIDTLGNQLINAVWRNNRIYTALTEGNGSVSNIRYMRLNTSTNTLEANASFGDGTSSYFIPAVTVDASGNVALTFTRSSSSEFGSMYFTGHLAGGSLQPSTLIHAGVECITGTRWGDFAGAAVDPVGFRRIWLYGEWADDLPCCDSVNDWSTWIGRVQFGAVSTIGVYNPTTGIWYERNTNNTGVADAQFTYGPAGLGWIPISGDWTGQGIKSPGLYNQTTGVWYLRNSNTTGSADITFTFGPAGANWMPIVGDWNGDGVDTIGLYNRTAGIFYLRNSNSTGNADLQFTYGPAGANWTPVVGDWTGQGLKTIGLYNPAASVFHLRNSNSTGPADIIFAYGPGAAGWVPRVGDWDGSNTDTIGLYDQSTGIWYLRNANTTGVADLQFTFGPAGLGWNSASGDWDGH